MKIGGDTNVTAVDADVRNSYLPSPAAYLAVFTSSGSGVGGGGVLESIRANHLKYGGRRTQH